jgi:hypothetical protein
MAKDQATEYLKHLRDKGAQREKLRDAVFAEIVAAGEAAGYSFTAKQLALVLKDKTFDESGGYGGA